MKKNMGIAILLLSLVCLTMGLISPFMTFQIEINMGGAGGLLGLFGGGDLAEQLNKTITYNIPQAMRALFREEQYFVGMLIGFFALVVPVTKTLLTLIYLFNKRQGLYNFIGLVGKFAMADVFCVGVFVAYLYTKFNQVLKVTINDGYYWFVAYVLLGIISHILIRQPRSIKEKI